MHKFDYSFLDNGMLPSCLVNVTASISSLKTSSQFRKNDFQKVFTELEKIAKIQSVKSSNEIEGELFLVKFIVYFEFVKISFIISILSFELSFGSFDSGFLFFKFVSFVGLLN